MCDSELLGPLEEIPQPLLRVGIAGAQVHAAIAQVPEHVLDHAAAMLGGQAIERAAEGVREVRLVDHAMLVQRLDDHDVGGGKAGEVVALAVSDTGIGIAVNKQRLIFEAFQQADGTTSREYGGTGLGLSISRELARLLGGEIRVASTPGEGSTFTLYLPLRYETANEAMVAPAMAPDLALEPRALEPMREATPTKVRETQAGTPDELDGKRVLLVDDDIRNVFALTSALEQHGMQVLHAESGKEGIELLKRSPEIEIILMDVMMPGLDGLDTMRIIRQLDAYRDIPIIAVTAKAMMGDRDKCLAAGATDYVAKPVNIDQLIATLSRTLPRDGAPRDAR